MKKNKHELEDDLIFSKRYEHPLDEVLKVLLSNIQSDKRCKNKVPMLEIGDCENNIYFLIPRKRLRVVLNRMAKEEQFTEKKLLKMAGHR